MMLMDCGLASDARGSCNSHAVRFRSCAGARTGVDGGGVDEDGFEGAGDEVELEGGDGGEGFVVDPVIAWKLLTWIQKLRRCQDWCR